MTTKNLNKNYECNFIDSDIMPLDTPVKPEYDKTEIVLKYDNDTSYTLSPSGPIRESTMPQSGRSMVEMLGTLAVIGYSAHSYRTGFAICK